MVKLVGVFFEFRFHVLLEDTIENEKQSGKNIIRQGDTDTMWLFTLRNGCMCTFVSWQQIQLIFICQQHGCTMSYNLSPNMYYQSMCCVVCDVCVCL